MGEPPADNIYPDIAEFYHRTSEETRLEEGAFQLEEARTRELILRFAPEPPATVLDIGGAAGAYSLWLAERGYSVHLIDATPRLVAEAERRSSLAERPLASCRVGDARALDIADGTADMVLLMGPMYHLTESRDRAQALHEATRVLQPGGWLFAAAISRFASALDGLARNLLDDPRFERIVQRDLQDGQHRNPTERLDYFTTAYFHRPDDLGKEVEAAGLSLKGVYGVEGPGWILPDIAERMADPQRREALLRVARMLETESMVVGTSSHLLAVAQRRGR
jgi:ubiquinone/menaquinone biosynthesis C-methylase UbiE